MLQGTENPGEIVKQSNPIKGEEIAREVRNQCGIAVNSVLNNDTEKKVVEALKEAFKNLSKNNADGIKEIIAEVSKELGIKLCFISYSHCPKGQDCNGEVTIEIEQLSDLNTPNAEGTKPYIIVNF